MGPIGGVLLHSFVSGPAGELFSPASRAAGYVGNKTCPNVLPDIATCLELYTMGLIKWNLFRALMEMHGCDIAAPNAGLVTSASWKATLQAHQLAPALPDVMRAFRIGAINDHQLQRYLRRNKVITQEVADIFSALNYEPFAPAEALVLWNRGLLDEATVDTHLRDRGIMNDGQLAAFKQLRYEIPPIGDLLHFAQTNATDPVVIGRFGLGDEFARFWQGSLKDGLTAQGISEDWARIYWQAHWVRPAIGQAQEALQRLRPGRVPAAIQFDQADFQNVMRENDILPYWRDRLQFLATTPVGLRQIKSLFETGQITKAEVSERFIDIGYPAADAPLLANQMEVQKNRDLASQSHGYTVEAALKLYKEHIYDSRQVRDIYAGLGYDAPTAEAGINHADNELAAEHLKVLIATLRQQFLHGESDEADATRKLLILNIPPQMVQNLVGQWQAEREMHRPHATLAQLNAWLQGGMLTLGDYAARLSRLGYDQDTLGRMVAQQAATLQAHRASELAKVETQHRRAAMHAYKTAKAEDSADLLAAVALVDDLAAEQLLKAHTKEEIEHVKAMARSEKAKVKGESKVAMAKLLQLIEDMPPP